MKITQIKNLFFPKFCLGCQQEGDYLCPDCKTTLEISGIHQLRYSTQNLKDLYFALDYQKPLIKNLVKLFKYEPFVKELAKPLTSLIIEHFLLLEKQPDFRDFVLIPIPLEKKKLKWRGFNQAEEIAKELSSFLTIPLINNVLIKTKETQPQVELSDEERKENIKGVFTIKNGDYNPPTTSSHPSPRSGWAPIIKDKKILLVDDVFTTGATMEECARNLKEAGAKEITGIVIARAKPEEDKFLT